MTNKKGKKSYLTIREEQLLGELALLDSVEHPGAKGTHLENLLKNFLSEELPRKYSIGSGFIVGLSQLSESGKSNEGFIRSKEMDIIIFDEQKNVNPLKLLDKKDYFVESVYGAVSVKKELTKNSFCAGKCNMLDNLISARKIQPAAFSNPVMNSSRASDSFGTFAGKPIISVGFSYSSKLRLEKVKEFLEDKIKRSGKSWYRKFPTMIVILGKGIIELIEDQEQKRFYEIKRCPETSLEEFFFSFLQRLNNREAEVAGMELYKNYYQ